MKKLSTITLSLMMAISLVACSTTEVEPIETTDTSEVVIDTDISITIEDTEEIDIDTLAPSLEGYDYETIEIDEELSDYDLSTAGEYTVVLILTDEEAETTKVSVTIVVEEKIIIPDAEELLSTKLSSKEDTVSAIQSLSDVEEETTIASNSSSTSSSSSSSSSSTSSSSGWNGGLNTDPTVYGLDPNDIWVQEAMKLLGQEGLCLHISVDLYNTVYRYLYGDDWATTTTNYYAMNGTWNEISSQLQIGDQIYYNNMKSGSGVIKSHVATYLGNGLALHGNWTGGVARISYAYQEAESYSVTSKTHTTVCASCSTTSEIDRAEYEALTADFTSDMCAVSSAVEAALLDRTVFNWCLNNYKDILYSWSNN